MRLQDVQRACDERLRELALPQGFAPEELIDLLSRRRGRPLHVQDAERPVGLCGMWLSMETHDVIYVDAAASGVRRTHILLHELAHVAMDHDRGDSVLPLDLIAAVFPDLDLEMVRSALGRDRYSDEEEQQAEVLAWMFQRHAGLGLLDVADDPAVMVLSATFGGRFPHA